MKMLRSWWFCGVLCACFVLFKHSMKLRETAIEQENLQLFGIITSGRHLWRGHSPFIRALLIKVMTFCKNVDIHNANGLHIWVTNFISSKQQIAWGHIL